jgi:hypothetical protein
MFIVNNLAAKAAILMGCWGNGEMDWWNDMYRRKGSLIFKNNIQVTESNLVFIVQILFDTGG